ncbi:hypothetical protein CVT25_002009 [Psilocybe cyanescens]|uniref:Cytochrome P450 n=1 Tax=Psilocybe cyanescens TaxID=93625 RepID=A0A409XFF8_PSICY|nr:hypothetical protein CVT25_002009 [Psilocybe cyanescens]
MHDYPVLFTSYLLMGYSEHRFTEWAKEYGGIISLKVTNGTIVVLSDMRSIKELLDDRSIELSSRPAFYGLDVVTGGKHFLTAPSVWGKPPHAIIRTESHFWKISRKVMQPLVSPQAVQKYLPIEDAETAQLLYDILHSPEVTNVPSFIASIRLMARNLHQEFYNHISRTTLSFITSIVFGQPTPRHDSPVAMLFRDFILQFSTTFSPEAAPVDFVPVLKYIPERWAPWKKLWRETRRLQRSLYFGLLDDAEKRASSGIKQDTFVEKIMERQAELGLDRETVAYGQFLHNPPYICGVLLDGGSETSASYLKNFVLCLVKSPASLRKAQKEIDSVIGERRMPVPDDIHNLPYVQAVIKETHRLRPVGPTAVPHASVNDCKYRGYTIPKGTPIFMNICMIVSLIGQIKDGVFHDPNIFERTEDFWPERYLLTPDGTKPELPEGLGNIRSTLQFGSGKRLCPGMHLANTNTSLAVMRLLWAFDFAPINESDKQPPTWDIEKEYFDVSLLSLSHTDHPAQYSYIAGHNLNP